MSDTAFELFDFHADDFGISQNSCNDIISLAENKIINSLSILPNMNTFSYAVDLLKNNRPIFESIKITVHLNFMEGHCCANPDSIPDLVDEKGYFKISWGKLFIYNYIPFLRNKIKLQLKTEIIAQTQKCIDAGLYNNKLLRFDGHQHTHMIPLVFEALIMAVEHFENNGIKTEYIRNTEDPIRPYYKANDIKNTFAKINIIKCLILNFYSIKIKSKLKKMNLPVNYLCGVFFSGNMDFERLSKILPYYIIKPKKQNRIIEILFHPGSVLKDEITEEFVKPDFNVFHLSEGRKIEYQALNKFSETEYVQQL